jgi:DNA-binding response OmpR family regulator
MATFLIIDDEAATAAALSSLLQREGHAAAWAQTAADALDHLRHTSPDLILLDLTMPRVDGLEILDALAIEPEYAHLRVAVFSGRDDAESIDAARSLGATDYILKGSSWDETYARIQACLPS